jgi:hypothetical protein
MLVERKLDDVVELRNGTELELDSLVLETVVEFVLI